MAGEPYLGEIRMFAGNFAPAGWAFCDGQPIAIAENDTLYTLIGTTYGGDGQTYFNLPNLASRVPIHMGTSPGGITHQLGEMAGTEGETLTVQQIPAHTHSFLASSLDGTSANPGGAVLASTPAGISLLFEDPPTANMAAGSIGAVGGSQPHENMQPFLGINFIISLYGVFPSQT